MKPKILTLTGDVMLGRLIDQLLPHPVPNAPPSERNLIPHLRLQHAHLKNYTPSSPWGTALPLLLHESDLTLINLETAVTNTSSPWPNKVFNYRASPENACAVLRAACVDYAGLANNHAADFGETGLEESVWAVRERAGVASAGAGRDPAEPAVLRFPRLASAGGGGGGEKMKQGEEGGEGLTIHVYAASDHPTAWANLPTFHFIDYSAETRVRLKTLLTGSFPFPSSGEQPQQQAQPDIKIFSVHWGPNYTWQPASEIQHLAHFLIDECGVDIVHGHSAHHVQGVEVHKGKPIIYGCGDFVDDYAVDRRFRNDLGGVWRVVFKEGDEGDEVGRARKSRLVMDRVEVFPTKCELFQVNMLDPGEEDHEWVVETIGRLSGELGTKVRSGERGQVVVEL
ncbi:CapA family protein [Aspergillus candidus]|uniref:Capsule synthesis protein CapA domain-containing protein n=1 Tax=Aspergillus candidus TaxID=41067 RepID=A0A2I2FND6_ASPCN|nr:hypothetical protein BDW47DRAFT_121929 [Aspergillus candidus]PLB42143.1 hypothetical protein BDW47DRAFT_121929 [Aspergillus candidus]